MRMMTNSLLRRPILSLIDDVFMFWPSVFEPVNDYPVNVKESDDKYILELMLPSFKKDEVSVEVEDNILKIAAKSEKDESFENKRFIRKEFVKKNITRSFILPDDVDPDPTKITAHMEDGVLTINLNKKESEKEKSKKIKIL